MKSFVDQEKEFIECLKRRDLESISSLECFGYMYYFTGSAAKSLLEKIIFDFDEDDLDTQEKFYLFLDRLIDGVCQVNYRKYRKSWTFTDVNQINNFILADFKANTAEHLNRYDPDDLVDDLIDKVVQDDSYREECYMNVKKLYDVYKKTGTISKESSIDFYNELLNRQRNNCIADERKHIIKQICDKLPYTKRKENSRVIGAKLSKIDEIFKKHQYVALGTSEENIKENLMNFSSYLSFLKELRKENFVINQSQCELMNQAFLDGNLSIHNIQEICTGISFKAASKIYDKYTQIKMKFLPLINVNEADLPKVTLGYNYNNYKIVSEDIYYNNIAKVFSALNEKDVYKLIEEAEKNKYIFLLIFFIDYAKEFNVKNILAVLKNYSRIMRDYGECTNHKETLGLSFDKLLTFGIAYEHADDFTITALGVDIVDRIVSDNLTSSDPHDYLKVYLNMLCRDKTFIPAVSGEYKNYYYESAHNSDCERLLIGKNCQGSCLSIGGASQEAYIQALTGENGDVIVFKDKNTHEFVARSLVFRAGNYAVLAPFYNKDSTAKDLYNTELLFEIASQMLNKSKEAGDTLEYIFATHSLVSLNKYYKAFDDDTLTDVFPYADLVCYKYLIGSMDDSKNVKLNSDEIMRASYYTIRDKIKLKDEITNNDLNKIRVLDVLFLDDDYLKEDIMRYFEFINKDDFDEVFLGQDWYIALKNGEVADRKILPVDSERQEAEIITLCRSLISRSIVDCTEEELFKTIFIESYASKR